MRRGAGCGMGNRWLLARGVRVEGGFDGVGK